MAAPRRLVLALPLLFLAASAFGCGTPVTEADCRDVALGESRSAVEDDLGSSRETSEFGEPHVSTYGGCSRNHVGVCCVLYDGDRVVARFWTDGCSC